MTYQTSCHHRSCQMAEKLLGNNLGAPEEGTVAIHLWHLPGKKDFFPEKVEKSVWEAIAPKPPILEIGFGKGFFLLTAAKANPDAFFLGIERSLKMVRLVTERIQRREIKNVRIIWGDAQEIVSAVIPDDAVMAYHIYFSDPWPKRRHTKRRLFTPAFVAHLGRTLIPGGTLHIATDVAFYFEQIMAMIAPAFLKIPVPKDRIPTLYEKKYSAQGRAIYLASFQKQENEITNPDP